MITYCMLATAILMVSAGRCRADWLHYLGPYRNATSPETGLARSWPDEGPNVLWTVPMGKGYGGAAVSAGKVYVMDRLGDEQDILRCLDLESGEEEWTFSYDAPGRLSHPGGRTVPAVDGSHVYTCGPFGHLHCINAETRKPVWSTNIWKDFGGERLPMWALSQNPLVYGDMLIVASQTPQAGVVAFDKVTGAERWRSKPLPGRTGYVTPTVVSIEGEDQIVMISAGSPRRGIFGSGRRGRSGAAPGTPRGDQPGPTRAGGDGAPSGQVKGVVVGLDPNTGGTLWSYDGWQCQNPAPNVTAIGDGRLFVTGGYRAGSAMLKVEREGEGFAVTELYTTQEFGVHVHPAIYYDGHLYGHCTTHTGRNDGMVCMDVDGNVKWKTGRSPSFDKGGSILADGLLLTMDGRTGVLYLVAPDPKGFTVLAKGKVLDTERCWAPLALTDGKLLVRDQKQMKCVEVK